MSKVILNLYLKTGTFSMINQMQKSVRNKIIYSTEILKSNHCDYNNAYILGRGDITSISHNLATEVASKHCAPSNKCITKIVGTTIDDAEDLDLVMSMYNLLEYTPNYSDMTGSLWFYSKYEATNFNANIEDTNNFKSLKYETKLLRNTEADGANGVLRNTTIVAALKYLSNGWRSLKMSLINFKVELKLKWINHYVLSANGDDNDDANYNNIIFTIKDTKLYVPVAKCQPGH